MSRKIIIGTRVSRLATIQAEIVARLLVAAGETVEIRKIKTSGDVLSIPLTDDGGKGLFVKELEEALIADKIDIAVHSMKDVPAVIPKGLSIVAIPKREDPRDVFLSEKFKNLTDLPNGARVGTSSPRRSLQIKSFRGDLCTVPIRGNIDTRIEKLKKGEFDGIILAAAGLIRLGLTSEIKEYLPVEKFIPSVGQGALAIEMKKGHPLIDRVRAVCNHEPSEITVNAERGFLGAEGGDCHTAMGAHAVIKKDYIEMITYLNGKTEKYTISSLRGVRLRRTTKQSR